MPEPTREPERVPEVTLDALIPVPTREPERVPEVTLDALMPEPTLEPAIPEMAASPNCRVTQAEPLQRLVKQRPLASFEGQQE